MDETRKICSELEVLRKIGPQGQAELALRAVMKTFEQNEVIAHYGDVWPYLLVAQAGIINITKVSSEGRQLGAMRLQDGDAFWSPSLLDAEPLPASLYVKDDCRVLLWHRDDILPVIQKSPAALWELCLVLTKRIRQASEFVEELSFQPVAGRLARLILTMFEESTEPQISRNMTLDEMAAMTGTTSVMVCKLLSRFASEELINVSRTDFELTDKARLEELANLNY